MTTQEIVLSVALLILIWECIKIICKEVAQFFRQIKRSIGFWWLRQKNKRKRKE